MSSVGRHYLELLKMTLTREGYPEYWRALEPRPWIRSLINSAVQGVLARHHLELVRKTSHEFEPLFAHPTAETMIRPEGLDNIQACVESVVRDGIPGDLVEAGAWRGGATIFMRALLEVLGDKDRGVWVADSFRGMPRPNDVLYPEDRGDVHYLLESLCAPIDDVKRNFERYGFLDDRVHFLEGWFRDTLPGAPVEHVAVLRIDGDMYESTMDPLTNLYPKLSVGGYVIVDCFHRPPVRRATETYRAENDIRDEIERFNSRIVFWRRSGG
jgi:hypothetical protein